MTYEDCITLVDAYGDAVLLAERLQCNSDVKLEASMTAESLRDNLAAWLVSLVELGIRDLKVAKP